MTVIQLNDVRRKRQISIIYIAYEIGSILGESDYPIRPEEFEPGDLRDFLESVAQVLDGSWIPDIMQEKDAGRYVRDRYQDALCRARVFATGAFEVALRGDGSTTQIYSVRHLPGDHAYHDAAFREAKEYLLSIADTFGIPALREAARYG